MHRGIWCWPASSGRQQCMCARARRLVSPSSHLWYLSRYPHRRLLKRVVYELSSDILLVQVLSVTQKAGHDPHGLLILHFVPQAVACQQQEAVLHMLLTELRGRYHIPAPRGRLRFVWRNECEREQFAAGVRWGACAVRTALRLWSGHDLKPSCVVVVHRGNRSLFHLKVANASRELADSFHPPVAVFRRNASAFVDENGLICGEIHLQAPDLRRITRSLIVAHHNRPQASRLVQTDHSAAVTQVGHGYLASRQVTVRANCTSACEKIAPLGLPLSYLPFGLLEKSSICVVIRAFERLT